MKNIINAVTLTCMILFVLITGVYVVSFILDAIVSYIGLLIMEPLRALSYLVIASLLGIGLFRFIEELRG